MYSETLTAKEQDANNFLSVAGNICYCFPNVAPGVLYSVVGYLGEAGALRWLDHHTAGEQRLVILTPEQVEELETVSKWSAKRFFDEYENKCEIARPSDWSVLLSEISGGEGNQDEH